MLENDLNWLIERPSKNIRFKLKNKLHNVAKIIHNNFGEKGDFYEHFKNRFEEENVFMFDVENDLLNNEFNDANIDEHLDSR